MTPIDLWRHAGFKVTVASLSSQTRVVGRSGIAMEADRSLAAVSSTHIFDLVFLPGGPSVSRLWESLEVVDYWADKWIAAICAAPLVLDDLGHLTDRKFTVHPSTVSELTLPPGGESVVLDGKLLTSRGAGTALPFALQVIKLLGGYDQAEEISLSICA